jgi:hypothetical protein
MNNKKTIEEAAEYYAHNNFEMHETNHYKALKQGFEKGAKWQQEQDKNRFSEEAVLEFANYFGTATKENLKWFEQFKNK